MKRRTKPRRLGYTARLILAYQELRLPPQAIIANVRHDKWCPCLHGKPMCKCQAEIVLETSAGKIEVLADGSCRHAVTLN